MATDNNNFEMTQDEMHRIKEAMKDKKFVELLLEYSNEISDPVNKKKYEEEIIAMEKQKGNNVRLLAPQSGFVVKTERLTDGMKVFVNICTSPEIQDCSLTNETRNGKHGTHVSLPHSLSPMKEDIDRAGKECVVYDVCFHPNSYAKSLEDLKFRQLLIETAFDTLEKQSNAEVDRKKQRFPKMKYKGMPQTNIIRPISTERESDSMPMDDSTKEIINNVMENKPVTHNTGGEQKGDNDEASNSLLATSTTAPSEDKNLEIPIPEYKIVHRGYFDMQNFTYAREDYSNVPKELVVEIKLPLANSAAGIDLDIFERELVLDSKKPPYHLEISLPYEVNEADGQAQFDTAENILVVTLPVVNPEKKAICKIAPPPSVVDITPALDNHKMNNEISSNLDSNLYTHNQLTDKTVLEDETLDESVSSMLSSNFPSNDDDMKDDDTVDDDTVDDDMILVDIDTVREHFKKDFNDASNDVDIEFDTSNFECFRPSSKLPPYCYIQSPEKINLTISIPDVKVVYLSLGFSDQQAYVSYPRNPEDLNSPCWELVIRLDDDCFLDKDNCGVDVTGNHMELILRKHQDSLRLWEKFFVGLSETSLKVEFFTTDNIAEDMLKSISANKADVVEMESSTEEESIQMERKFTSSESRLSQLLQNQDDSNCVNNMFIKQMDEQSPTHIQKNPMNFKESNGITEDDDNNTEDDGGESNISSKLDQTNIEENKELSSPEDNLDDRRDSTTEDESPTSHHQLYERAFSHDSSYEGEAVLHSILKHSKSDGEYYCDTEEDELSCSANSFPDSLFDEATTAEHNFGRRRLKSVTFNDEPTIFEFAKLSKRQIKKQMKEERLRQASQHKSLLIGTFSKFSQSPPSTVNNGNEIEQKGKSKKKDKCEKKNRSYSDGLLQVPNSILTRHKNQKKKKKNKKNNNQDNEDSSSNSMSDISPDPNAEETPVLSNPLIFELE